MNPLVLAAGANIIGGLLGNAQSAGDSNSATEASRKGMEAFENISLPDIEKMKLALEQYQSQGQLTPELQEALGISGQDQLANIQLDPRLRQAQMDSLKFLQQTGQMGLTPVERAQVNQLRQQTEADSQSRIKALLQQQDSRGVGSSDMALAARMQEAQASANRQAQSTDDIAAQAFQRALQSMTQGANLAGSMESSQYAREAALADAQRQRELANIQNQQNVSNTNVQAKNAAQQFNLQNAQTLANQNVDIANKQQQYNKELQQQQFQNQMSRAQGVAGQAQNVAKSYEDKAQGTRDMYGGITKGLTSILGTK